MPLRGDIGEPYVHANEMITENLESRKCWYWPYVAQAAIFGILGIFAFRRLVPVRASTATDKLL